VKAAFYLTVDRKGGCPTIRKTLPVVSPGHVALRLNLEIPDRLFVTPTLEASVKVPEDAVQAPVIEADVIENIEEVVKAHTGLEIRLNLIAPEEEGGAA